MKTMTVGEFKSRFSAALDAVAGGETVVVCYGRDHRKVAALVPYAALEQPARRPLGLLKGKVRLGIKRDFAIDDEHLLSA